MQTVSQIRTRLGRNRVFPAKAWRGTDFGVFYKTSGLALMRVKERPSRGQYAVRPGGVYTFSSGEDRRRMFLICYGEPY